MARNASMPIDANKLREQLRAKGLSNSEAGRRINCSDTFMATTMRNGKCGRDKVLLIETVLRISYESIKPDPQQEPGPQAQDEGPQQMSSKDLMELCREIKVAAEGKTDGPGLEAVVRAIDENMLPVREMVEAVRNRAFRVATMTDLSVESIAKAVSDGMAMWWKSHSSKVQGAIFTGVYNALAKIYEPRNAQE